MIYLDVVGGFLIQEPQTVYIFSRHTTLCFPKELTQRTIRIVSISRFTVEIKIFDSYVLGIIRVHVAGRGNESVRRIVVEGEGTARQHISVEVIAYVLTAENSQSVISIICKTGVGRIGNITRRVVSEAFLGNNGIVETLGLSLGHSAKLIISIAEFYIFVK